MITPITSYQQLVIDLRTELITQSDLNDAFVLNGKSFKGSDFIKEAQQGVWKSFDKIDNFIIFEVDEGESTNDMNEDEDDSNIAMYKTYTMSITIYGPNSHMLSSKIKSRFLTQEVMQKLLAKGISLNNISKIECTDEFVNDCLWDRTDFEIEISVMMKIQKKDTSLDYEKTNIITEKA